MISLNHLTIGYGSRHLLENAGACINGSELTALIGRNGAGKSTLLRAIAGLQPYKGEITVNGLDIRKMSPQQRAASLACVTSGRPRIPNLRCHDVVAMGRAPYTDWIGRLSPADRRIVDDALAAVGMSDYADRPLDSLSDGECQRVMIARALAQDTPVILLDEPTSFLDLPGRYGLCNLLATLAHEQGKCILFSTHELDIAMRVCDRIALMDMPLLRCLKPSQLRAGGDLDRLFGIHIGTEDRL